MSSPAPANKTISRELRVAVERLQDDIARVQFWADALGGFATPIPDYSDAGSRLNRFILPRSTGGNERGGVRERTKKPA